MKNKITLWFRIFKKASNVKATKALDKATEKYSGLTWLRASIQAIPYIGGSIDTLFSNKANKIQKARIEDFLRCSKEKFQTIEENKIDYEFLESGEFFSLFQDLLEKVIRTYEAEKIKLFSSILANSVLKENSKIYYKEGFIETIFNLSALHIEILEFFYKRHIVLKSRDIEYTSVLEVSKEFNLDTVQAEKFCDDLMRYGLLYDWGIGKFDYAKGRYGMAPYANQFIRFIQEEVKA